MAISKRQEALKRLESYKTPIREYMSPETRPPESVEPDPIPILEEPIEDSTITNHFESILIRNRGSRYKKVASWSHYNDPITSNVNYRGRSRIWGDSELASQERIIEDVVRLSKRGPFKRNSSNPGKRGQKVTLDDDFIALIILIMRIESGFNLDAAAGTTSASSLGQFVKKTGKVYGIQPKYNLWDFISNARALINHSLDNKDLSDRNHQGLEYVYARHHDGPSLLYGGLKLSKEKVMPLMPKVVPLVKSFPI